MSENQSTHVPPALVAVAGWIVPGAGYLLLKQTARGLTIGLSIVALYVTGLLVGGVRIIEVPGYGDHGEALVVSRSEQERRGQPLVVDQITEPESTPNGATQLGWVMWTEPLTEIRNKPWYIAQILAGPINLAASWGSVAASHVTPSGEPVGFRSHSRTNEIGVLYTAVAGMLNLLAMIDSTSRAMHREDPK
jgi:hypothetical protein